VKVWGDLQQYNIHAKFCENTVNADRPSCQNKVKIVYLGTFHL